MKRAPLILSYLLLIIVFVTACDDSPLFLASNEGGISGTGSGSSISGSVYKGPLESGSRVTVHLIEDGELSEQFISGGLISNQGEFSIELNQKETEDFFGEQFVDKENWADVINDHTFLVSVSITGFYFDETRGRRSLDEVTLKAVIPISQDSDFSDSIYINSLTHIAHDYTLQLLRKGIEFEEAEDLAQMRVLELLIPIIDEQTLMSPFRNIGLFNTSGENDADNEFLLYISALFSEAANTELSLRQTHSETIVTEQQSTNRVPIDSLLDALILHTIDNTSINAETLALLETAQENLDLEEVLSNLDSIFPDEMVSPPDSILDSISNAPRDLMTVIVIPDGLTDPHRRLCYDGAYNCQNTTIDGATDFNLPGESNGYYDYKIQIALAGTDFSEPMPFNRSTPNNHATIPLARFPGSGYRTYEVRVRKEWFDGQIGDWAETSFIISN